MRKSSTPIHPGIYIRKHVIPSNLSVKDAAELIKIGRPALSNLLNGNSSLSSEMAVRLEKAFGVNRDELLKIQHEYDEFKMRQVENEIVVRTYTPNILEIHARQIEAWSEGIDARSLLPALIRRLVNTTNEGLTKVDFPAFDNSQRKGWDGYVEANVPNPWIPTGSSGWEFGVDKNSKRKADMDYSGRVKGIPLGKRKEITFVFITPRNWPGKDLWAENKKAQGDWKDVRAYDASDLEQWIEESIPTQVWFSEKLGTFGDIYSLDQCWIKWATVTEPELSKDFFNESVEMYGGVLKDWLSKQPDNPLLIAADSKEEAIAFLVCAIDRISSSVINYYDKTIMVKDSVLLRKVIKRLSKVILMINSDELQKELEGSHKHLHTIIVSNKGLTVSKPDITLDLPSYEAFRKSMVSMGIASQGVSKFSRESGLSLTVLRRRLSRIPAIKSPEWANDLQIVRKLIPLAFVGAWDSRNEADREILSYLFDESKYDSIEQAIAEISSIEDSPIWTVGHNRGVVSKVDALFVSVNQITEKNLKDFFAVAIHVLSEDDPALDLPEKYRFAAALFEKSRNHSSIIRNGICETLVLLSINSEFFQDRVGINIQIEINNLIRKLLHPLNERTLLSQQNDLPRYAEAAPEEFLRILEDDLKTDLPQILTLLRPAKNSLFSSCPRTGLLWAMELLAWKPERLPRVVQILAKLSEQEIDDNWGNKPINSLKSIFRSWMPQTSANLEIRKKAFYAIVKKFLDVGWQLCCDQFDPTSTIGDYAYRPRWRNDATGAGQPLINEKEIWEFRRSALDIALGWKNHDENTLSDLILRITLMTNEDNAKVWHEVKDWLSSSPNDAQKIKLQDCIRRNVLSRWRRKNISKATKDSAQEIYELLTPQDTIMANLWLFAQNWVDELDDENMNYEKNEERTAKIRSKALKEIWNSKGSEGITQMISKGDAGYIIGWLLVKHVLNKKDVSKLLKELISNASKDIEGKLDSCVSGLLNGCEEENRISIIGGFIQDNDGVDQEKIIRILQCSPFRNEIWKLIKGLREETQSRYWTTVRPRWEGQSDSELKYLIDKLIEFKRPKAAAFAVGFKWKEIESRQIISLLQNIATKNSEEFSSYQFASIDIERAFEVLNSRNDISQDVKAQLEFLYIKVLENSNYGIPNLETQIAHSPELFIQALGLAYRRNDNGEDPPEWFGPQKVPSYELATAAYSLMQNINIIPGTREDGSLDQKILSNWIFNARSLCRKYGRVEVGDQVIGKILSSSQMGIDEVWPCETVREVIEEISSKEMAIGLLVGLRNSGGAVVRGGDGGEREKNLADKYRNWAHYLSFDFPFVSRILNDIAKSYEEDAFFWNNHDTLQRRLEL